MGIGVRELGRGFGRGGERLLYCASMKKEREHQAQDANYERRVRESFGRQGLMRHLGAELARLGPGQSEIQVACREELTQQHGYFHAGVTGAIADTACGYAAYTLMPESATVLTAEYKMNLLAPARGERLIARAEVVRAGRTLTVCQANVYAKRGEEETHCATLLATIVCLAGKSDKAE